MRVRRTLGVDVVAASRRLDRSSQVPTITFREWVWAQACRLMVRISGEGDAIV